MHVAKLPLAHWRHGLSLLLMVASGFAGLGYQSVWTQQSALWLGHESASVLAVVSAFFGGLAIGALLLGKRIERSPQPVLWYVLCELVIAGWGVALLWLMPSVSDALMHNTGAQPTPMRQWFIAFMGTFLLFLPSTAAMGATLPAMSRITTQWQLQGWSMAGLYASNTLGAVLGVLVVVLWLVPSLGLQLSTLVCVALNVLCAIIAATVWGLRSTAPASAQSANTAGVIHPHAWRLAVTGLLGIGYEVMVVRVLSQVAEDTVYTFALLLAVYLVGTSLGAAAYQRWLVPAAIRHPHQLVTSTDQLGRWLFAALAWSCLAGTAILWAAADIHRGVIQQLGPSMGAALGAEALLATLAFFLPTLVMGALFSHLCSRAHDAGFDFGSALGVNTLGAALAAPLFGVILTPLLGPKWVLLLIAAAYLALAGGRFWRSPWISGALAAGLLLAVLAPPLRFVDIPDGGHIVQYKDGVMAAVSVVEDAQGVARLRINNRQQEGSSDSLVADARQALLPLYWHADPHRVLFLGLGTGVTSGAAAQDPHLQVDAVELLPEVIAAAEHFRRVFDEPGQAPSRRPNIIAADARRFVRASSQRYDVVIADNFQPARSGSGALYTVEHFEAVKQRLADGGLFCQWLPLHQLDLNTLRSIVKSFLAVYPQGTAILANNSLLTPTVGLIGRANGGTAVNPEQLGTRLAKGNPALPPDVFGLDNAFAVLGSAIAGPSSLARFAQNAPLNTDDRPVVAYSAPRITYVPDSAPKDRLIDLLQQLSVAPQDVLYADAADSPWAKRLNAYWQARHAFIQAGRNVEAASNPAQMLAQVQAPLLNVLRISPDFSPAYSPLLSLAHAIASTQPDKARALLLALVALQPERPQAREMLQTIAPMP